MIISGGGCCNHIHIRCLALAGVLTGAIAMVGCGNGCRFDVKVEKDSNPIIFIHISCMALAFGLAGALAMLGWQ